MTRVRVVSLRSFDPLIAGLSPKAFRAWARALDWSCFHGTDGLLTPADIESVGAKPAQVEELLARGVWQRDEDGRTFVSELRDGPVVAEVEGGEVEHELESPKARSRRLASERQRRYRQKTMMGPSVYVMRRESDGALKIGYSDNPGDRSRSIRYELGCKVELIGWRPGTLQDEKRWHQRFASLRIGSTEWFRHSDEIVNQIALREYVPDNVSDDAPDTGPDNVSDNVSENGAASLELPGSPPIRSDSGSSPDPESSSSLSSSSDLTGSARVQRNRRRSALPADWKPTPEHIERASKTGLDLARETIRFRSHHEAKGSLMANWNAAFTTWLLNATEWAKPPGAIQHEKTRQEERQRPELAFFEDKPTRDKASPTEALEAIGSYLAGNGRRL